MEAFDTGGVIDLRHGEGRDGFTGVRGPGPLYIESRRYGQTRTKHRGSAPDRRHRACGQDGDKQVGQGAVLCTSPNPVNPFALSCEDDPGRDPDGTKNPSFFQNRAIELQVAVSLSVLRGAIMYVSWPSSRRRA